MLRPAPERWPKRFSKVLWIDVTYVRLACSGGVLIFAVGRTAVIDS